jgi:bifunctional DNA-binding transcriptional regulator/antitoxin component of YhaV-PrlF toxin-antitoxin module
MLIKAVVHSCLLRCSGVPLTERVDFKAVLQKGNRVQLPKLVRWRFKLETNQVLKVTVTAINVFGGWETFYARMDKSGRITVPKLTLKRLKSRRRDIQSLTGAVFEVRLEPA